MCLVSTMRLNELMLSVVAVTSLLKFGTCTFLSNQFIHLPSTSGEYLLVRDIEIVGGMEEIKLK